MDGELEDGEISGPESDNEMAATTTAARPHVPPVFGGHSFQSRAAARPPAAPYRSVGKTEESSDSEPESSDEEAAVWRKKRQKVCNVPQPTRPAAPGATGGRRVNNIWGSVVQEQCQDAVATELGIFGMEGEVSMSSRNVETYNFVLARKIMEKEREKEMQARNEGEVNMLDTQLEEYMKGRGSEEGTGGDAKRKRPLKDRLGPRAEMDVQGRYEITEDDPVEKVAEEIAHRLQEPKKDLIERVVNVIGTKKAIELLGDTATQEASGGVYTVDGSRRRTPGGVYLYLLKNTPSITKAQVRKIFAEENQMVEKNKKAAQKRRRHMVAKKMKQAISTLNLQEHDDVSRETFASDTNEALESLEDAADELGDRGEDRGAEQEEEEEQVEAAAGTEDTAVVYISTDLEVF